MLRFTRTQAQPIGVDIGHDSIKLLQLQVVGNQLEVVAASKQAIPEEVRTQPDERMKAATEMIRQMLRQQPFVGRNIVAALPRGIVHVKNLRLPIMPVDELEAAVQFEAKNIFPFDTEQAFVRYLPAGEVRQGTDTKQEVIVLASKHDDVERFIETLHRCGGVIESLDFEPCAIYRGIERFIRRREDEQEVHVLVDVGLIRSQVIIGKGRDISFVKPIDVGGRNLNEAVSRKLGISVDEARSLRRRLAETTEAESTKRDPVRQAVQDATRSVMEDLGREISLCLRYYSVTFRGQRPNRVRLVGGEACDPQLHMILNSVLTIPAEPARPLRNAGVSRMKAADRAGLLCEWSVAFGLGLKKTTGYFGSPDGVPRAIRASTGAEVIDLSSAVETQEGSARPAKSTGAPALSTAEVANA